MDKLPQWLIVLLLAGILVLQFLARPSAACLEAVEDARKVAGTASSVVSSALNNYEADVYGGAENINQQILLASENTFAITHASASWSCNTRLPPLPLYRHCGKPANTSPNGLYLHPLLR